MFIVSRLWWLSEVERILLGLVVLFWVGWLRQLDWVYYMITCGSNSSSCRWNFTEVLKVWSGDYTHACSDWFRART